ncbi:subtilisin-like serine protease [Gracilaria domingensis]|nr:subtilisin-like serine protease [Gracilaria domingensis]
MKFTLALGICVSVSGAFAASIGAVGRSSAYRATSTPTPYATPAPEYIATPASAATPTPPPGGYTAPETGPEYVPSPAPYVAEETPSMDNMCWMETKKCCYVEKADGYECKDYYADKYARCYAKFKYVKKCDKAEDHGKPEKPDDRIERTKCEKVYYDKGYGPHVKGYPASGESKWYDSKELPMKPYGVEGEPQYSSPRYEPEAVPAGASYVPPAKY